MSTTLKDPRLYCEAYLKAQKITVNERGELKDATGKNNMAIFDTMYLDYLSQVHSHNVTEKQKAPNLRDTVSAIQEKVLQKALNEIITIKKLQYRAALIDSFKCDKEDLTLVKAYVKALTGKEEADDVAVMAHWMWQVKTKMLGKTPSYHMMPILFGKQEGGKTVAMNKLIGPINNFRLNISLDQMGDDRYFRAMSENYVIVFDEMQGADRTDIDALKKQVTIDDNDYRPLGTNDVFKVRQACSFIGATNRPVAEQIVDSTGMRRFWQIDCLDKLDWQVLSSTDYVAMWKGIDENKVDGYILPQISTIRAKQEGMVAKDQMQMFIESAGIVVSPTDTKLKEVTATTMYRYYREWAETNGFKPMDNSWFGRRLAGKGISTQAKKIQGKTHNVYTVPEAATVNLMPIYDDMMDNTSPMKAPHLKGLGHVRQQ